jgi:hypothetical protein
VIGNVFVVANVIDPVIVPPASGKNDPVGTFANTKAVVAICVVFVPGAAVGAVGTPVSAGDASSA